MPGCSSESCRICVRVFSASSSRSAALRMSSLERAMGVRLLGKKRVRKLFNMLSYLAQTDLMLVAPQNFILSGIDDSRWRTVKMADKKSPNGSRSDPEGAEARRA